MEVKILGNQSPFQLNGKKGVGYLVRTEDGSFVLDAGSGSHSNLDVADYENLKLVISHGHHDHIADMRSILYTAVQMRKKKVIVPQISIYLPEQYEHELENKSIERGVIAKDVAKIYRYSGNDNLWFNNGRTCLMFRKTKHSKDSYAMKVKNHDAALGYTGDIRPDDVELCANFFKNADAIISECTIPQKDEPHFRHIQPYDCAELKNISGAKKMYLSHLDPLEPEQNYLDSCLERTDNAHIAEENLHFCM